MTAPLWAWPALSLFLLAMLAVDLWAFHRPDRAVSSKQAALKSAFWVSLGLAFTGLVWALLGGRAAGEYLTGFLIEYSLSVDNLLVFAIILAAFAVPDVLQHRVLLFGIFGALVLRALFILAGTALISQFHWTIYVLGAFLIVTGLRMTRTGHAEIDPERSRALRLARRLLPITSGFRAQHLFVREQGRVFGTPLLAAVVAVMATDVVFAMDSVPAIFSITLDPFIVFSANAFALLGLRTLYFLLAGLVLRFTYLQLAVAALLVLVGIKMLLRDLIDVPIWLSLAVIGATLLIAIMASIGADRKGRHSSSMRPVGVRGRRPVG